MTNDDFAKFLQWACRGHAAAIEFLTVFTEIVHFWDDLIDRDPAPTDEMIHKAMWASGITLPRNEFYRTYFNDLNPLVANAILDWRVANRIESGEGDRAVSFIIRSNYVCLIQQTALIIGGSEWAEEVGVMLRSHAHSEGFEAYVKSLGEKHGTL